jgi:hypothetical protein
MTLEETVLAAEAIVAAKLDQLNSQFGGGGVASGR